MITYAKKIIENVYGNRLYDTQSHGPVLTKAEYVYGDSVASYTPVYIKHNNKLIISTIEDLAKNYGNDDWIICKEEGKQEKEYCELNDIETWTEKGWTKLYRIIRHVLAPHKKMVRICTDQGLVDVTDDHSLLDILANPITPNEVTIGTPLLHNSLNNICIDNPYIQNNSIYIYHCQDIITAAKYINYLNSKNHFEYHISEGEDNSVIITLDLLKKSSKNITKIQEIPYQGFVYDLTTENHHFAAGVGNIIVHNTDSVFFTFNLQTPDGKPIRGKQALEITIELAQEAGHLASSLLKGPHDLEYEKTFMPFCLLSKKRYVGMLYETDPNKCKRKEMGIVLKRRDNAPIVKDIYGGIIDILMKEQNINMAIEFLQNSLQNIVDEKFPMDKLIITKSLRSGYKNPQSIAHKVLSDRITTRDPGNKPSSGDRIPFVYINTNNKKALQGDKIETPTFIKENNLKLDYSFYITNQIMKPVQQLFALVLEKIWELQKKHLLKIPKYKKEVEILKNKYKDDYEKFQDKLEDLRNKEVKVLLFDKYLRETNNEKQGMKSITTFFSI